MPVKVNFFWAQELYSGFIEVCGHRCMLPLLIVTLLLLLLLPSVLWHCCLGVRKGIRPVKKWAVGCMVICLERGADLHMAQRIPLPLTVSCFCKIQIGFTFLVPAYPASPRRRAVKRVCVCVCVCVLLLLLIIVYGQTSLSGYPLKWISFVWSRLDKM